MRRFSKIAFLLIVTLVLTNCPLRAQNQKTWQWVKTAGGQLWDMNGGIGCDSENKLYLTGTFMDVMSFGSKTISTAGASDFFVSQYDEEGNITDLWHGGGKRIDETFSLTVSKNNDVLIGGIITDTVTMGNIYSPAIGQRLFISKLGANGNFAWLTTLAASYSSLSLLGTDANGKIYASGVFTGNLSAGSFSLNSKGGKDIFLARLDMSGVIENLVSFGGPGNDVPSALTITGSGKILLAGNSTHPGSFEGFPLDPLPSPYTTGSFIVELDENLNYTWKTQILSLEYTDISGLGTDQAGNIYVGGCFGFNIAVGDTVITTKGVTDGFLIKYDMSGALLWMRSIGSWYYDDVYNLAIDKYGRAVVVGDLSVTIDIDGLVIPCGANSPMAIQFSEDGKAIWADCISGSGMNTNDYAVFDKNANLFVAGSFKNTIEKDTATFNTRGDQDVFLAMYYSCPTDRAEILGKDAICPGSSIELSIHEGYGKVIWNDTLFDAMKINVDKPGRYWVTMKDDHHCTLADTTDIRLEAITGFSLGEDISVPADSSVLLQAPVDFSDLTWQDNSHLNTFLANAENQEPGSQLFWLTAVDPKGCIETDTLQISFYTSSGLKNRTENRIFLYPNPVKDILTCDFTPDAPAISAIEITDLYGRKILVQNIEQDKSASTLKIDLSQFFPGVYLLRLKNINGNLSEGFCVIKER